MRVVLINPAAERFLMRTSEQAAGARVTELFGPMGARFEQRLSEAAAAGHVLDFEDWVSFGETGMWQRTSLVPLSRLAHGLVLGVARNITDSKILEVELREHAKEVEQLATHDTLTGLANRRAFTATLEHTLALVRRGAGSSVLFLDVDDFKRCNDERGHAFGDEVLVSIAGLLKQEAREVDVVARIGGDEFAALLMESSEHGASVVAGRMKANVEGLGTEIGIPLGLSVGIVQIDPDGTVDSVMSSADRMMYESKRVHRAVGQA
jgi:diguanylate cyclase (GGDEF)-like protein